MKLVLVYTVIVLVLLFYLIFGHNGILKYNEMVNIQKSYEKEIQEMEEKISLLQREIDFMKRDSAYLEYVIRRELGLQKSDEDQYILTDNATVPGK